MNVDLYEIGAITGRKFRILATSSTNAQQEAMARMTPFEAGWGVMSVKRIKAAA